MKGRAWAAQPLTSHLEKAPSVWWEYCLEEERQHTRTVTSTDSEGRSHSRTEQYRQWHTIDTKAGALDTFEVVDDTGSVPVRLTGANVVPRGLISREFHGDGGGFVASLLDNRTGRYRETERAVVVGDTLFIAGDAELDETSCVPVFGGSVLVSTRSEESHHNGLAAAVALLIVVAVGATTAASGLLIDPLAPERPTAWLPGLVLAASVLAVAWGLTIHNRLRLVAQRVDRAWSLIDVQLQRRHDLIPGLARAVSAYATHERELLESVTAQRRAAGDATASDQLTDHAAEQTVSLRRILAVAEAYPQLRADASFLALQRELADTETRIACCRTFYNDSITLLRDRARTFPGVLVARHLSMTHRDLMSAEGFELTAPAVEHTFA